MQKKWFYRMLFSYLPVFFVISLSLLLIAYLTISEMSKNSALKANEVLSHHAMQAIDNALNGLDEYLVQQIVDNEFLKDFYKSSDLQAREYRDYQTASVLRQMMENNRLIDSIYLYRTEDNMILTPSTFVKLDLFGDKQFVGQNLSSLLAFRWTDERPFSESPGDPAPSQVVSLVKFGSISSRSLMVVNVSSHALSGLIRSMTDSKLNYLELLDSNGVVFASKDIADDPPEASFSSSAKGRKEWSHFHSAYTGWTIRSGIYGSSISEWVSSLFYLWVAFGFAVIAAGIVWLVYVTRRNYMPIRTITNRIEQYSAQKRQQLQLETKGDEFKYIEAAIEDLLDQSELLQEQSKENMRYRKKHLFHQLMEGAATDLQTVSEQAGIELDCHLLFVALVEIDEFSDFGKQFDRRDQYLLKQVIQMANQEIVEADGLSVWSEWLDDRQFGVLYLLRSPDQTEQTVFAEAEKLRVWVEANMPLSVTVGIGTSQSDMAHAGRSYESAVEALAYKSTLGTNRLIKSTDLASKPQGKTFRQLQIILSLCQAFRSGDSEWKTHYRELDEALRRQLFSRTELNSLLHHLLDHLHKEIAELPEELQAVWNGGTHARLLSILQQRETAEDMAREFYSVLEQTSDKMQQLRANKHNHQLIREVKQYILAHFSDPDLSHANLESEFGLSPSYISRLFKEEFGIKFIDYVTQTRMEKAIVLLKEFPDKTVQEIAEQVGYLHGITFIRSFKKYTGSTPGNFRKSTV